MPKFIIFVHASADSEAEKWSTKEEFAEMGAFNAELAKAGTLFAAEGLLASSTGARVTFSRSGAPVVSQGPFALENLVTGFWLVQLESFEEAVSWAKKVPFKAGSVEVRQVAGTEDFPEEFRDQLKAAKESQAQK